MSITRAHRRPLPGFGISLGLGMAWLGVVVLLPLAALALRAAGLGTDGWLRAIGDSRVQAALELSFGAALLAAFIAALVGALVAWVVVRYRFPGRRLLDALVDLPFALPTAVAGIALTAIYAPNGSVGRLFAEHDIKIAYATPGIVIALVFIGLPFVVRTLQPVLEELEPELEEAADTLGATRWQTLRRVVFPELLPALITGFALSFARALGEYGSVVFISGNMPMRTEITPLLIIAKLEQFDCRGATALAVVMLVASFLLLLLINTLQRWSNWRHRAAA